MSLVINQLTIPRKMAMPHILLDKITYQSRLTPNNLISLHYFFSHKFYLVGDKCVLLSTLYYSYIILYLVFRILMVLF